MLCSSHLRPGQLLKPGEALSVPLSDSLVISTPSGSHSLLSSQGTCQRTGWGSSQVSVGVGGGTELHSQGRVCVCDRFSVSTRPGRGNETSEDRQVRKPPSLLPSVLPCLPCPSLHPHPALHLLLFLPSLQQWTGNGSPAR